MPTKTANSGNHSIALLSAAGSGALLFTLLAGFFVYSNTQRLVAAKDWVEHTQEVLTSLQNASQRTDRIEFGTRLYLLGKDASQLDTARANLVGLETVVLRLKTLVADNPGQNQNVDSLNACTEGLQRDLQALTIEGQAPASSLLNCRKILSLMAEKERGLFKERSERSQHSSVVSITTECLFIGLSLLTLVILFGFLLRDALARRQSALQTALTNENLEASVQALEENVSESRLLTACRDELQLCVTMEQMYLATAHCLARLLPGSYGVLCMTNPISNMIEVASTWGEPQAPVVMADMFPPESCCGLRLGQLRWRRSGVSEIDCTHFHGGAPSSYLCIPLMAQGETLGVVSVICVDEEVSLAVEKHIDGMRHLLQLTGINVASLNLRIKLENQSIRDSLTGLFNRHFMETVLQQELSRALRQKSTLAVFMLDLDHFKRFNDSFGHGAGDTMLRSIAAAIRTNVRAEDVVCRYGGEEFVIILPNITVESARERAETIRIAVNQLELPPQHRTYGSATISIGIAFYPIDAIDGQSLLNLADQALYRAKHGGRNQIALADPDLISPRLLAVEATL